MKSKRADQKWVVLKTTVRAKARLSDTGMSIAVTTPESHELPQYQKTLDFRVGSTSDHSSRGFPVSLKDAERFATDILAQVSFVRGRLAETNGG